MTKQYYDHRTKLCEGCAHFSPAGERAVTHDWMPEGCRRYGYSLTGNYPEPADDCRGFQTPEQYAAELERIEKEKKMKKSKSNSK